MSVNLASIEKLGRDNYDTWKIQIEAVLIKNDHWNYVNGSTVKPQAGTPDLSKWINNDSKAKADLVLSMNPSELTHIKKCKTSNEVWEKMKSIYESKGPAKKANLLKQLLFKKMAPGESALEHMNAFFEIIDKLGELEIEISKDLLAILLLYSIPDSFDNFRCAIESRDELPDPEILKIKILEEWEARKNKNNKNVAMESNNAMYVKNTTNYNHRKNWRQDRAPADFENKQCARNYRNFKCNYCGDHGHKGTNCRKKFETQRNSKNAPSLNQFHKKDVYSPNQNRKSKQEGLMSAECSNLTNDSEENLWCLDSGATSHMCNNLNLFTDFSKRENSFIKLAVDRTAEIVGVGCVPVTIVNGKFTKEVVLQEVLCVPELKHNLISISKATRNNKSVLFKERSAEILRADGSLFFRAQRMGNLYHVRTKSESVTFAKEDELKLWHLKLGHLNESDLRLLKNKDMVRNITFKEKGSNSIKDCSVCLKGKQTVKSFPKEARYQSTDTLALIHSDLCGPMPVPSFGGSRYFATFIDDKSRYTEVAFLKTKDQVKEAFVKYKSVAENRLGKRIKILRTDNGKEYRNKDLDDYLAKCGIKREYSAPYSPQQNSRAERANRTLVEMARCLMFQANLSEEFWAEAVNCAAYIRNRCPSRSLDENKTPYELFVGFKPTVSYFKIFGQKCFALNRGKKGKFDPRSEECVFVGYSDESKAYRVWNAKQKKILITRDVKFIDEFERTDDKVAKLQLLFPFSPGENLETRTENLDDPEEEEEEEEEGTERENFQEEESPEESVEEEPDEKQIEPPVVRKAPGRPKKIKTGKRGRPSKLYKYRVSISEESMSAVQQKFPEDPQSLKDAISGPYRREWADAIELEFNSLAEQGAWEIVDRPENQQVIGSKWVLRTKYKKDGSIEKFKARLVGKGCAQKYGIDYDEIFSPVARLSSVRTVIAHGIQRGYTAYQLDFVMAYINGDLEEEIFMELPDGFRNKHNENKVCLLKRSLYGLKQSGRQWFCKLDEKLKSMNFVSLSADKCIYKSKSPSDTDAIIIVYVDDLIVLTKSKAVYEKITKQLEADFKMKDLGPLHYCLGLEFTQEAGSMKIKQTKLINDVINRFNQQDSKISSTPMDSTLKITKENCPKSEDEKEAMKNIPYRQLIGSLMYISMGTRPDITHAVNFLSQFNENPGQQHWKAAIRVVRYLKGTKDIGLEFRPDHEPASAFADADWASDVNDRRSYTGYLFKYAQGPIAWESRKQKSTALSTTEAEYVALSEASKEAVHLKRFLSELSPKEVITPIVISCDNQSALKLVRNPVFHARSKHIDIRYHYVREVFYNHEIDLMYVPTDKMQADILTKPLGPDKHKKFSLLMGVVK